MSYQALFRKYRSQSFDDLVGQEHIVQTLTNAIEKEKIAQVYLFTGPRGTGKTSTARLLAKALNCTGGPSAILPPDCPICADITAGNCMDVLEMDAASEAGVEKVREHIVEASEYQPTMCKYRIFIIDEVHDLSPKAFDALLKTIEEPPAHAIFILATTEFHKVPPTIRSRCQKFEFHRGSIANLVKRLNFVIEQEGIEAEPAVTAIARLSDGGYRDALTLLEQAVVTMEGTLTLDHVYYQLGLISDESTDELLQAMARGDLGAILEGLEGIYQRGRDPQAILESMMYRLADMTRALLSSGGGTGDAAVEAGLAAAASRLGQDVLLRMRAEVAQRHKAVREVTIPRIWLEAELLKIALDLRAPAVAPRVESVRETVKPAVPQRDRVAEREKQFEAREAPAHVAVAEVEEENASHSEPQQAGASTGGGNPPTSTRNGNDRPEGDASLDAIWQKVAHEMGSISKTAEIHLAGSQAVARNGNAITVNFMKEMNADWVKGKSPLIKAIRESWQKFGGEEVDFEFVATGKRTKSAAKMEGVSVESPLEGDRLAEAAKRIFGQADGETDNTV